jgi:class 3 adenylate cyclase
VATVLFADIHGFTSLTELLDFESVSDLIRAVWSRLDYVIEAHGGYIDKHMGDGVMAVWGAPYAGDNDAEQAVTAALALQIALNEFAANSTVLGADQMRLRVGVNSGAVFAGYLTTRGEYTVIGDAVNVAHRFQEMADPGTVVIGETTFRLVRGAFKLRRLAPLALKGKTIPVTAFLVETAIPAAGRVRYRGADSLATYMVGREKELDRLEGFYRRSLRSETPLMVLAMGEAGLGKSRLLMEFTSLIETDDPAILIGAARALAQTSRIPFYLWKMLWNNWFGVVPEDSPDTIREKYVREVNRLWGKQLGLISSLEAAHFIGSLAGIEWPESRFLKIYQEDLDSQLKRSFEMVRELLRRIATSRATILWFDDLQWADRSSLDLLAYLMDPQGDPLPLLILGGARPEFLRQHSRWANLAEVIHLDPLPMNAATVAAAYPDLRILPTDALTSLAQRCDGNPYFLEEMVKGLVKSNMGDVHVNEVLDRLKYQPPDSLRAMLQARLDDLSREARAVALLASVVGRVFWVGSVIAAARATAAAGTGLLTSVSDQVLERIIQDGLRQLVRAELAFPRASTQFSLDQEFIFKHSLLREVAYSLIPNKYLPAYHLAVGRWLSARQDFDYLLMAAEHLEMGGAYIESALHYEQASRLARSRGATTDALSMTSKAQELRKKGKHTP